MKSGATIFVVLACVGLILAGIGSAVMPQAKADGILVAIVGYGLIALGSGFLATSKGRHPAWGLLGLLTPMGLVFLCVLQDAANREGQTSAQPPAAG